jgi:hypothetical protein
MKRTILPLAISFLAAAAALAGPSAAASAAPAAGDITATVTTVPLGGSPWKPTRLVDVDVQNAAGSPRKAYFMLELPSSVELGATDICDAAGPGRWVCGGDEIAAGGDKAYKVRLTSSTLEPVFGVENLGHVTGQDADGNRGRRNDFLIRWPDRTAVRLAAAAGTTVDGRTTIDVTVTNTGSFAIGGYSLAIILPKGVEVTDTFCDHDQRLRGAGCEIYRGKGLAAGAVDAFTVTTTVEGGPKNIRLHLTPDNRYSNKDTTVSLTLGAAAEPTAPAAGGTGGGDAQVTPVVETGVTTEQNTAAGTGGSAAAQPIAAPYGLPENAAEISFLMAGGSALLALAVLIVVVPWRRSGR